MYTLFEHFFSVVLKLLKAVLNIPKSSMISILLWAFFQYLRIPPPCELLDCRGIHRPVVQPGPQVRHVLVNEPPVLTHGGARQGALAPAGVPGQHVQHPPLSLGAGDLALPTRLGQPTGPVLLDAPLVHVVQTLVIQMDHDGLSFVHSLKSVPLSHNACDLHQLVLLQVETRHLTVNPYQSLGGHHVEGNHAKCLLVSLWLS